jgi:hypothetical protein
VLYSETVAELPEELQVTERLLYNPSIEPFVLWIEKLQIPEKISLSVKLNVKVWLP